MLHVSRICGRAKWPTLPTRPCLPEGRDIGADARRAAPSERPDLPDGGHRHVVGIGLIRAPYASNHAYLEVMRLADGNQPRIQSDDEGAKGEEVEACPRARSRSRRLSFHSVRPCACQQPRATARIHSRPHRGQGPNQAERPNEAYGVSLTVRTIAQKLSIGVSS